MFIRERENVRAFVRCCDIGQSFTTQGMMSCHAHHSQQGTIIYNKEQSFATQGMMSCHAHHSQQGTIIYNKEQSFTTQGMMSCHAHHAQQGMMNCECVSDE